MSVIAGILKWFWFTVFSFHLLLSLPQEAYKREMFHSVQTVWWFLHLTPVGSLETLNLNLYIIYFQLNIWLVLFGLFKFYV